MIKSTPRLESGDLSTLPEQARRTASLFRTVFLADVRGARDAAGVRRYRLVRIGRGLCVPSEGRDIVVTGTGDSPEREALGFLDSQVFQRAEQELARGRIAAATSNLALYLTPGTLSSGEEHRAIEFVYAFRVEPESGALSVLVWAIPEEAGADDEPRELTLLEPGLRYTCGLDVRADRILGRVPIHWNFAMRALPPGRKIAVPRSLRPGLRQPANALEIVERMFTDRAATSSPDKSRGK